MPQAGFEPTIPVFEWVKTVHAATVISTETTGKRRLVPMYSTSCHPQVQSLSAFAYANASIPKVARSHIRAIF
jgi:hypothetical protein